MSQPASHSDADRAAVSRLAPLFVAIVLVEAATVAALYWFGRHFGAS